MKKTPKLLMFGDRQMIRPDKIISLQILPNNQNEAFKHLSFDGSTAPEFVLGIVLANCGGHLNCIADREAATFLVEYWDYSGNPYPELFEVLITNYYSDDF